MFDVMVGRRGWTHIGASDKRNECFLGPWFSPCRRAVGVVALHHLHLLGKLVRAPLQYLHTKSHMNQGVMGGVGLSARG